jgi:hypothetical protein
LACRFGGFYFEMEHYQVRYGDDIIDLSMTFAVLRRKFKDDATSLKSLSKILVSDVPQYCR